MSAYICQFTGCKTGGKAFANKYALEKHCRTSHPVDTGGILSGKRKRRDTTTPNCSSLGDTDSSSFNGICACGYSARNNWTLTRHMSKCPVIVPPKDILESFNFKVLRVPLDSELEQLKQAMSPLSPMLKASICINARICIPGVFPVICNSNKGLLTSTYNQFGITGDDGLKMLWEIVNEGTLSFEEAFLIKFQDDREVFLPSSLLLPPEERNDLHVSFHTEQREGLVFIRKGESSKVNEESLPKDILEILDDLEDDKVDDEDADKDKSPEGQEEVLRLRGGDGGDPQIPRAVIANCNRYVHPRLWSNEEIRVKIRMNRDEFLEEFCPSLVCATSQDARRDHESKCFLFMVKMSSNPSFKDLSADFMINKTTAQRWFLDILIAYFLTNGFIPAIFNDEAATDAELDSLLESVRDSQSPYIKHLVSAFQANDGRPVTLINSDNTALLMEGMSSEDFSKMQDFHSGRRGDKWAMYMPALVDGQGKVVAIPSGGGIGKSPRGGDCAFTAEILTRELEQGRNMCLNRLLVGTRNNAVLLNTDNGFVEKGNVNLGDRVLTTQRCADLGIPHIHPFRPKDKKALRYDPQPSHRLTIIDNEDQNPVLAANSSRISTALRQSVEQFFSIKNVFKILKGRINQAFFRPLGARLCAHYTAKHPNRNLDLTAEYHDVSLIFVIFAAVCGLSNWFGAGCQRSTSGPAEQVRLANSLLTRLSTPNVLSDSDLGWGPTVDGVHVAVDPCDFSDTQCVGILSTQLGNVADLEALGIPQVQPGEGRLLREPSGGGDFCLNRGEGLLSLERQRELRPLAEAGHYGSPNDYMQDAVTLPTSTEVRSFRQDTMPRGWSARRSTDANFPGWSGNGGGVVVTLRLPSHFKNNRLAANMHTIVLFFSDQPSEHNGFTGLMRRFFASWCSCKMGSRTNTLCAHRSAALVALMARWFFRSRLTPIFRVIDIWRHPNMQPICTGGVPAGNRDRTLMSRVPPCRPRRSEDKRAASNRRFDPSFTAPNPNQQRQTPLPTGQTHGPSLPQQTAHPSPPPAASPPRRPPPPPPRPPPPPSTSAGTINHPSGLGGLLNSNNCCYVNAVVQSLTAISSHDEINWLDPSLNPFHDRELLNFCETLYQLCNMRHNPSSPPFSTASLRDSMNNLLRRAHHGQVDRFQPGRYECSVEFIHEILVNVSFNGFFVDYPVSAQCRLCNRRVVQSVTHKNMISICVAPNNSPVSCADLYNNRVADTHHFQDQVVCHCICPPDCNRGMGCSSAVKLQGELAPTQGNAIVFALDRTGIGMGVTGNNKVLTQLRELDELNGYNLMAVMCHVQRTRVTGHWISFVKKSVTGQPIWWRLDDCRPVADSNPFLTQCNPNRHGSPEDFTIDVLIFKQ